MIAVLGPQYHDDLKLAEVKKEPCKRWVRELNNCQERNLSAGLLQLCSAGTIVNEKSRRKEEVNNRSAHRLRIGVDAGIKKKCLITASRKPEPRTFQDSSAQDSVKTCKPNWRSSWVSHFHSQVSPAHFHSKTRKHFLNVTSTNQLRFPRHAA